ncbi:flagellar biosynthetic protein FliO [Singulisphaera sp. PoT]|uniref:flagellar biosynthetic protein FliO n=1 Tax=Singulisphaera sp. PoT TaxID=3411797 RepID=UPI003BF570F2
MPSLRIRRPFLAGVVAVLIAGLGVFDLQLSPARADQPPADNASTTAEASTDSGRHLVPQRTGSRRQGESRSSQGSSGWWLGTAGIALALAVCGGLSIAARHIAPKTNAGPLRVVGRTSLSPKHTVYLLKAGGRTLIVGTGPQGAPSLLGELDEFEDDLPPQEIATRAAATRPVSIPTGVRVGAGFDRRVGDDE